MFTLFADRTQVSGSLQLWTLVIVEFVNNCLHGWSNIMSADNDDYMYKILVVGNTRVGKTAYISRYCGDPFNPAYISTVGIDFRVKDLIR